MRGTLDRLHFDVVKYEPHPDNRESKVYLGKTLRRDTRPADRVRQAAAEIASGR